MGDFWQRLAAPFPPSEIDWRVGNLTKDRSRGTVLAYLNARAVMDRLDDVCGPDGWRDEYTTGPDGGVLCTLHVRSPDGVWLAKCDGAPATQIEAVKGGLSGALKRAAVKWGIGRYLYFLDGSWMPVESSRPRGEHVYVPAKGDSRPGFMSIPTLPAWALPGGSGRPHKAPASTRQAPDSVDQPPSKPKQSAAHAEVRRMLAGIGAKSQDDADALCRLATDHAVSAFDSLSDREAAAVLDGIKDASKDHSAAELLAIARKDYGAAR